MIRDCIRMAPLAAALLLVGCATPYSPEEIGQQRLTQTPTVRPQVNLSSMDPLLRCVGSHFGRSSEFPVVIGSVVQDSTKKTGVDVNAMVNMALHKMAGRAGNIQIATFAMGTESTNNMVAGMSALAQSRVYNAQSEGVLRDLRKDPRPLVVASTSHLADMSAIAVPDWVVAGGVTSVANGFMSKQNTGNLAGSGAEGGMSSSASVDIANIQLSLRNYAAQTEFPGAAISLSVHYQQLSTSIDGGVLVAFSVNGQRRQSGVRLGHSDSRAQIAEDALRVGLEYATAFLLAERAGLDISTCPIPEEQQTAELGRDEVPKALSQVGQVYEKMSVPARQVWAADRLKALGYRVGSATAQGLRESLAVFQISRGIPPSGQLDTNTFAHLHLSQFQAKTDVRSARDRAGDEGALRISTPWPSGATEHGSLLSARVNSAAAGHLYCLFADEGGPIPLFPNTRARSGFVTGRTPVELTHSQFTVTLTQPGLQQIWCIQTQDSLLAKLPAALQPGGDARGFSTLVQARQAVLMAADTGALATGEVSFQVREPAPAPAQSLPAAGMPQPQMVVAAPAPKVLPPKATPRPTPSPAPIRVRPQG